MADGEWVRRFAVSAPVAEASSTVDCGGTLGDFSDLDESAGERLQKGIPAYHTAGPIQHDDGRLSVR